MSSDRPKQGITLQIPNFSVYAIASRYPILPFIYQLNVDLGLQFKLYQYDGATENKIQTPHIEVFNAEGLVSNEKLFLFENKQGNTYMLASHKKSNYLLLILHNNKLGESEYSDRIKKMKDAPILEFLPNNVISEKMNVSLRSLLHKLD